MLEPALDLPALDELVRIPAPAPVPQSLAFDGESLWVGSWETGRVYGLNPQRGSVFEDVAAPGKPVGSTMLGDELRFVLSENGEADNRFIRRFVPGHGFKSQAIACPEDTGSFLAWDGTRLWLSQRFNKRIFELDAQFAPVRTLEAGEQIVGMAFAGGALYLSTWLGRERGGCRIARLDPSAREPRLQFVAASPFVAVSLASGGDRLWTNDGKRAEIVAFAIPA